MRLTTSTLQEILTVHQSTSLYTWAPPYHSWHLQAQSHPHRKSSPWHPLNVCSTWRLPTELTPNNRDLRLKSATKATAPRRSTNFVTQTNNSCRTKRPMALVENGEKRVQSTNSTNCTSEERQEAQNKCSHACFRQIHHCNTTQMSNNRHITRPDRNIISVARSQQCFSLLLTPPRGADTSKTKSSVILAQRERKSAVCHQRAAPKR